MSAAFDTLRLARTLRDKARFSPEQAEGMADAIAEVLQGDLATKADLSSTEAALKTEIQAVRAELKTEIQAVRTELKIDIQATKADLIKWVVGMVGFQTVVLLGAALALAHVVAK